MSMRFYGIDFVARELNVHPSSLRRWEDHGLISPERATMGKTTLRIYDERTADATAGQGIDGYGFERGRGRWPRSR
jgi:hypothetical protein